jgi:hypothetical protein
MSNIDDIDLKNYRSIQKCDFNNFSNELLWDVEEEIQGWHSKQCGHKFDHFSEEYMKDCREHSVKCMKILLSCYPGKRSKDMNSYITALADDLLDFTPDVVTEAVKEMRKTVRHLPSTAEVYQAAQTVCNDRHEVLERIWNIIEKRDRDAEKEKEKIAREERARIAKLEHEEALRRIREEFERDYRDGFDKQEAIGVRIHGEETIRPGSLWVAVEFIAAAFQFDEDRMASEIVDILRRLHGFGNPHDDSRVVLATYQRVMQLISDEKTLNLVTIKSLSRDAIDEVVYPPVMTPEEVREAIRQSHDDRLKKLLKPIDRRDPHPSDPF